MKILVCLVAEVLRIPEKLITDNLSIANTDNWDSLRHMELIVSIEETFDIKLTTDDIVSMVNMGEIKKVLVNKGVKI